MPALRFAQKPNQDLSKVPVEGAALDRPWIASCEMDWGGLDFWRIHHGLSHEARSLGLDAVAASVSEWLPPQKGRSRASSREVAKPEPFFAPSRLRVRSGLLERALQEPTVEKRGQPVTCYKPIRIL